MIRGSLFTRFFLQDGIRGTHSYLAITQAECERFSRSVRLHWTALERFSHPSEAETESEFIYPLLTELGWLHLPQQTPGKGRHDIADALLFLSGEAKDRAVAEWISADRFRHGAVVVENEARDTTHVA